MQETVQTLGEKLTAFGRSVDERFEQVDRQFEQVDQKFLELREFIVQEGEVTPRHFDKNWVGHGYHPPQRTGSLAV